MRGLPLIPSAGQGGHFFIFFRCQTSLFSLPFFLPNLLSPSPFDVPAGEVTRGEGKRPLLHLLPAQAKRCPLKGRDARRETPLCRRGMVTEKCPSEACHWVGHAPLSVLKLATTTIPSLLSLLFHPNELGKKIPPSARPQSPISFVFLMLFFFSVSNREKRTVLYSVLSKNLT